MREQERYRLGMSAYHAGEDQKAIAWLEPPAYQTQTPQAMLGRYYLGRAHYRLGSRLFEEGRFSDAAQHFQAALSLNDVGGDLLNYLARCYLNTGEDTHASEHLETLLKQNPDNVQVRIQLALVLHRNGARQAAWAILEEGLDRPTPKAALHYQLGILAAARKDLFHAERSFERAILADPEHAAAHERLAQVCSLNGQPQRVLPLLERAAELEPHNARVALQMALLASAGRVGERAPRINRSESHPNRRFDEAALQKLSRAITAEPDFVEAFLSLPETGIDREVFCTLAAILERALRDHPEFADLHYHCGAVYERLGQRLNAIQHTEQALAINPHYINALIQLATLYARTEQWAMGVERLEQAIQAGADDPDVYRLLGELYRAGGQTERARVAYQHVLEMKHDDPAAREALEALSV